MTTFPVLFLVFTIICMPNAVVHGERILTSPKLTDFGSWGIWEYCPEGTFVTGMQLHVQPYRGKFRDDRALTGIRLFCNKFGENSQDRDIKSSVDNVGKWGKTYFCPGLMTGFQLRSEKYRSAFVDDTAGNNLRMFCDYHETSYKEGDGLYFGKWTDKRLCQAHEAVCGISTQVERGSSLDKTGLNNVMVKCCDIPHPMQNCVPNTTWQKVVSCEASKTNDQKCAYSRKLGVAYTTGDADSLSRLYESQGHSLDKIIAQLQSRFKNVSSYASLDLVDESSLSHYWQYSPSFIWERQILQKGKVTAEKGTKVTLYQILGKCGMLEIWGARFKMVVTDAKTNHDETSFADFTNEMDKFLS